MAWGEVCNTKEQLGLPSAPQNILRSMMSGGRIRKESNTTMNYANIKNYWKISQKGKIECPSYTVTICNDITFRSLETRKKQMMKMKAYKVRIQWDRISSSSYSVNVNNLLQNSCYSNLYQCNTRKLIC